MINVLHKCNKEVIIKNKTLFYTELTIYTILIINSRIVVNARNKYLKSVHTNQRMLQLKCVNYLDQNQCSSITSLELTHH